ncbi:Crp/Fnr family transcriptional regulator [Antarcticimicrobium sediminis]|uniref:Crp/Fnr family transcriptional regulator n=1 Tax=Antarcticimicrobium sediminis TaxID=2546227 RepID=A0A4V2Z8K6_9RHOB|nr:Crp/Fnr family transcriptional regulator [Antarcticimicrobium sediminis]TDE40676.1 Crp/Fnr family transcriptional regulator [Antarcticimicrobium sediminis]
MTYPAETTLIEMGETSDYFGYVRRGIMRMQRIHLDGTGQIVGLVAEGDVFGSLFEGGSKVAIEAVTEVSILTFKRGPFEALMARSAELDHFMLQKLMADLDRTRDWMLVLLNRKVSERLAGFLVVLCIRYANVDHLVRWDNGSLEIKVPISRCDLASLLGTRVESVSRAFSALAKKGIIHTKTPYLIEVQDVRRLLEEAGGELTNRVTGLRT